MPNTIDSMASDETRFFEVVFPESANHYGTLFGGNALLLMGKAAFLAATRYARCHVVMASVEQVSFEQPVRVGSLIECVTAIERVGRTSMTVAVRIVREDAHSGQRDTAVQGTFEMVAVDAQGHPQPIRRTQTKAEPQKEIVS